MKIIIRNSDKVLFWGTNNNNCEIEFTDNKFIVDGKVVLTNIKQTEYELIEDSAKQIPEDAFVGYVTYTNVFEFTDEYLAFNTKTHNCLSTLRDEYYLKSQDDSYGEEERQNFSDYCGLLDIEKQVEHINPSFTYPIPPDSEFPFIPACSI